MPDSAPLEPKYPVAVIRDDGVAEVHASLDSITRSVESPDFDAVLLIDSNLRAFTLVAPGSRGWFNKVFVAVAAPQTCQIVPVPGVVPPEAVTTARQALSAQSGLDHQV